MLATPLLSFLVAFSTMLDMTIPLLYGLITREFFNTLSGDAAAGWNVWTLVALFLLTRVPNQSTEIISAGSSAVHYYLVEAMLRRNIFRTMLRASGFSTS